MKKYLLFLFAMLYGSIGAWAAVTYDGNKAPGGSYAGECGLFTTATAGDLNTDKSTLLTNMAYYKTIFIVGPVNEDDIKALNDYSGSNDIIVDLTLATGLVSSWLSNITNAKITGLGLPDGSDLGLTNSNLKVVYSTAATGSKTWGGDTKGGDSYKVNVLASGGLTQITDNHFKNTYFHKFRTFDVYGSANYSNEEITAFKKLESIGAVTEIATYGGGDDPYIVSGCNVTIQMDKVTSGLTLSDQIALAKAEVSGSICTLTVTGEINDNDLIALGGTDMTGAERIDLSGATLASGSSIENMQIPASLTSLVLPKDQTVGVSLRSKFGSNSNLKYAYSPSSSKQNASQAIADYVWVNQPGGLWQAMETESTLLTAVYVKIACDVDNGVRLNENDAKFGNHGITGLSKDEDNPDDYPWQYVDLSGTFFGVDATNANTAPHGKSYRIILPDNLTGDHMAIFASKPETDANDDSDRGYRGKIAAVYSYSGTTLKLMEINDESYHGDALADDRIVRIPSTDAIEVVSGTYNSTTYGEFGDPNGTNYQNLLDAINGAASCIKSVTLNNVHPQYDNLTFSNTNIETLQIIGARKHYSDGEGSAIDVTGCTKLKALSITNSVVNSIDAHGVTTLESVNLSGTNINGTGTAANGITNLSGCSALTAITTSSSTKFLGELDLASTALTSFATTAEVTGDINLNACSSLTKIDISSTQFKNSTSKIHVHATDSESDTNVLTGLNTAGQQTIQVPAPVNNVAFDKTRIHPNDDTNSNVLNDNIAEAAASGDFELEDKCKIVYDAATGIATVTAIHAGCFSELMEKNNNYSKFPEGTTFKFTSTCVLNENDLKSLCGYINKNGSNVSDMNYRSNMYYVDLYDVPQSSSLCDWQNGIITNTINWMRTNDRQFKGLILPKDHTVYGKGISLIQGEQENTAGQLSTCSEFIAYYKTKEIKDGASEATNLAKTILFTHVYNAQSSNSDALQTSNNKLTELLTAHGLNGAADNCPVDLYSVSTNSVSSLNYSALVGNKGYVETFNNEMVGAPTTANIYAHPKAAGEFTTFVNSSSIGVTPTEVLKIDGTVSSTASDVAASINKFTNGPRVLDLSAINPNDDTFLGSLLAALTNSHIEYIVLPGGKSKSLVCGTTYSASMTNLKAVISSSNTNLVAFVKQAGSLAEARYYATGGSISGTVITPTKTGLTSVTLSGNLNATDIAANITDHYIDENGHWTTTESTSSTNALWGEQGTITKIDLKDAVFGSMSGDTRINQTDMNFSYAGLGSISDITLPTNPTMTLIPAECFMGITTFDDLCVPYNYTKIDNAAFLNTYMSHLTTTDANGALVDNGPKTYTLSKNLEEIGSKPASADANGVYSLDRIVFPQNRGVTDVYVLAHQVPKCYANAFPANMLYGWGGFKGGDFPYCREKYDNSSDGSLIFTVLHFPDQASFTASTDAGKEKNYNIMKQKYTDVTKIYTKKEQTGAVDANGDAILWPTFSELRRAYNQGTCGIIWDDWKGHYDGNNEVVEGFAIPTAKDAVAAAISGGNDQDANHSTLIKVTDDGYNFTDYEGWHQFVLSLATYVAPDETVVNEKIERTYVQNGYYTFCIPFDMTEDEVIELLGVPASTDKVVNKYKENSSITIMSEDATPKMPAIHTLKQVTRTMKGTKGTIKLSLTENLASDVESDAPKSGTYQYYKPDDNGAGIMEDNTHTSADHRGKKIVIRGGYPYIIKPWRVETKTDNDLGLDVLNRYSFSQVASCVYRTETYIQMGKSNKATSRFAKPFEGHEVQATFSDGVNATTKAVYKDGDNTINYKYRFQGQFWEQTLPLNSYYLAKDHLWYYYGSERVGYVWKKYHSIINVSSVLDEVNSKVYTQKMKEGDNGASVPFLDANGDEVFEGEFKNVYTNGHDDKFISTSNETRRVIFDFDDGIIEYDNDGNEVSGIEKMDGVDLTPMTGKIYDLSGQYVGDSVNGLAKGMYVVNGKKVIVK